MVAVVQVAVAALQWQVAQKALWDAQTPHVQLWAEGGGIRQSGAIVPVTFRIRNGSNVTLFNGKVWTRIAVVPVDHPEAVWNSLEYQDSIVMGPDDIEDYPLATGLALTPSQQERLGNGASMVALALKTEFPDSAGRIHHRYICYRWRNEAVRLLRSCPTPPQD